MCVIETHSNERDVLSTTAEVPRWCLRLCLHRTLCRVSCVVCRVSSLETPSYLYPAAALEATGERSKQGPGSRHDCDLYAHTHNNNRQRLFRYPHAGIDRVRLSRRPPIRTASSVLLAGRRALAGLRLRGVEQHGPVGAALHPAAVRRGGARRVVGSVKFSAFGTKFAWGRPFRAYARTIRMNLGPK